MHREVCGIRIARIGNHLAVAACALFALVIISAISPQPATAVQTFNVKSAPFNAVGDGVTDDTGAIQAALNAATPFSGSIVLFPPGTYYHSGELNVYGAVTLMGDSKSTPTLRGNAIYLNNPGERMTALNVDATGSFGVYNRTSNTLITGVTFSGDSYGPRLLDLEGASNCTVNNCQFLGGYYGAYINGGDRISFESDNFVASGAGGSYDGIYAQYATNVTVKDSQFANYSDSGIWFNNLPGPGRVTSSSFTNNYWGLAIWSSTNVTVDKNIIQQGTYPIDFYYSNNVLASVNTVSAAYYGARLYSSSNAQVIKNRISNCSYGVYSIYENGTDAINSNQIDRISYSGIDVSQGSGSLLIDSNLLTDCGLSGTTAVIYVGTAPYSSLLVQKNAYSGNQAGVSYFIRCLPPAPPAVVTGNKTNTLLPTLVGP